MIQILQTRLSKNLLYYYVFYKNFYKFIFLHKPLCEKYKSNTLKIFGLYVCRSCLLLYTGFFISLIYTILTIKTVHIDKYFYLGLLGCILTFAVSYPPIYARYRRITKDFIRFYDGIFLAAFFVICFKFNIYIGIASIVAFLVMRYFYNKKRPCARICKDCPNLIEGQTCEGYIQQKEALLKVEEEYSNIMTAWLMNSRKGI